MIETEEIEVWMAQPTAQADATFNALQQALESFNKAQCNAGLMPTVSDPIAALISMLGLILASVEDEDRRRAMYRGCGVMLSLAIEKARETGAYHHIEIIKKGTGPMN
jgi:hypothetical protein